MQSHKLFENKEENWNIIQTSVDIQVSHIIVYEEMINEDMRHIETKCVFCITTTPSAFTDLAAVLIDVQVYICF